MTRRIGRYCFYIEIDTVGILSKQIRNTYLDYSWNIKLASIRFAKDNKVASHKSFAEFYSAWNKVEPLSK